MNRSFSNGRPALLVVLALGVLLGACSGPRGPAGGGRSATAAGSADGSWAQTATCARRGSGYYLDDGPGCTPPPDLDSIPDAVPRPEPILARATRPYVVFGREYRPMTVLEPYKARGVATWYGRRYHGNPTSSGERYDMYGMTAAHPTLPIPSYARVTNLRNGRSVVVRVNDRGPFLGERLIDLSYTAAARLGYVEAGSAQVEVELITEFGEPTNPATLASPQAEPASIAAAGGTVAADRTTIGTRERPSVQSEERSSAQTEERLTMQTEERPTIPRETLPAMQPGEGLAMQAEQRLTMQPGEGLGMRPEESAPRQTGFARGAAPVPRLERGYWLQLGAFGSPDNADAALRKLSGRIEELGAPIDVVADGGLYKLQAGPWATREAAQAAGERIRASTGLSPFATRR